MAKRVFNFIANNELQLIIRENLLPHPLTEFVQYYFCDRYTDKLVDIIIFHLYTIQHKEYMSLKYGLLGLLNYGEMTGYELDKAFKDSLEFFWQGQTSQIYRELTAMEKDGWLSSRIEVQTGKPNRKVYAITKQGNAEFMRWLRPGTGSSQIEAVEPDESVIEALHLRSTFLMKLFFAGELEREETAAFIRSFRDECRAALKRIKTAPDNIGIYAKKLKHPEAAAAWHMVALFGRKYYRSCEKWAGEMLKMLSKQEA